MTEAQTKALEALNSAIDLARLCGVSEAKKGMGTYSQEASMNRTAFEESLIEKLASIRSFIQDAGRDQERYRFLRERVGFNGNRAFFAVGPHLLNHDKTDAQIDAALQQQLAERGG